MEVNRNHKHLTSLYSLSLSLSKATMSFSKSWPEPIVRVQSLSESGIQVIPERYVKPSSERPSSLDAPPSGISIPLVDLRNLDSTEESVRRETMELVSTACREWGFFQVINHGVSHELMAQARESWREFFHLPADEKQRYANSPATYEGYGSRLGVEKGAILDWGDYFFLNYLPMSLRDQNKWPTLPSSCRQLISRYGEEVVKLCERLMKILSLNLGLRQDHLQKAFGGNQVGACLRANFYPRCPQPDLTLGLSPHSDPGCLTVLLPDDVPGLQVRKGENWVTVKPTPNAFIVNIGDQIQVLSNAIYKSVEHRVIVNSIKERISLALFYNPKSDIPIKPAPELVSDDRPAMYKPMTYNDYRLFIRAKGPCGKSQVESLKSSR